MFIVQKMLDDETYHKKPTMYVLSVLLLFIFTKYFAVDLQHD